KKCPPHWMTSLVGPDLLIRSRHSVPWTHSRWHRAEAEARPSPLAEREREVEHVLGPPVVEVVEQPIERSAAPPEEDQAQHHNSHEHRHRVLAVAQIRRPGPTG